jgi:hypothetical protein
MTLQTTLLKIDYGPKLGESFPETVEGFTIDDAVADILAGTHDGRLHAVYSIHDSKCEEVSELVAERIAAAWIAGQFVSPMAREFVDYMGGEVKQEAA